MIFLQLYYEFFKIGLFAVGGGLATLPFLSDLSVRTAWYTQADLADLVAISESTPGPLGVNMATYVGAHASGFLGSVVATLGLVTPSVIIIIIVAKFLLKFKENKNIEYTFYGLRPASTALIAAAGLTVVQISLLNMPFLGIDFERFFNWPGIILAVVLFLAMERYKKHPFFYIALSGIIGISWGWLVN